MNPKDKAKELINTMYSTINFYITAKKCALIAVDELIEHLQPACEFGGEINKYTIEYWQDVKQEINNL